MRAEKGCRCFSLKGPIPFDHPGVLAAIANPLAGAGLGIFAVSTFDTDDVLVVGRDLDSARRALEAAGHRVGER